MAKTKVQNPKKEQELGMKQNSNLETTEQNPSEQSGLDTEKEQEFKQDTNKLYAKEWVFIRGSEIKSEKVANAIYEFALKVGYSAAIKIAQDLSEAYVNGVMSNEALEAINSQDEEVFLEQYKNALEHLLYDE